MASFSQKEKFRKNKGVVDHTLFGTGALFFLYLPNQKSYLLQIWTRGGCGRSAHACKIFLKIKKGVALGVVKTQKRSGGGGGRTKGATALKFWSDLSWVGTNKRTKFEFRKIWVWFRAWSQSQFGQIFPQVDFGVSQKPNGDV